MTEGLDCFNVAIGLMKRIATAEPVFTVAGFALASLFLDCRVASWWRGLGLVHLA